MHPERAENACDACGHDLGNYPVIGTKGTYCSRHCMGWADDTDQGEEEQ
jgi:hypothetical protein